MRFSCPESGTMHGFGGYFESVLYKDVSISQFLAALPAIQTSSEMLPFASSEAGLCLGIVSPLNFILQAFIPRHIPLACSAGFHSSSLSSSPYTSRPVKLLKLASGARCRPRRCDARQPVALLGCGWGLHFCQPSAPLPRCPLLRRFGCLLSH